MKPLVVIPSFVTGMVDLSMLETCLSSLRHTVGDACDVLVVDDGSPALDVVSGCRGLAEGFGCEFFAKPVNSGFSATVNVGLRRAINEERDAVLVNADIEFTTSTWLSLMQRQTGFENDDPAAIVGALLLYPNNTIQHAGIYFCQPGDDEVLTVNNGSVPIGELVEGVDCLVGYRSNMNKLQGRGRKLGGGYAFERRENPYSGPLLGVETSRGLVRVTPNHRFTVQWTERARAGWAVYLMRRGDDWRLGQAAVSGRGNATGPFARMTDEQADAIWILDIKDSRGEALQLERRLRHDFRVPTEMFRITSPQSVLTQAQQDEFWRLTDSATGARAVAAMFGRDPETPFMSRSARVWTGGCRFKVAATNMMPGLMTVPTTDNYLVEMSAFGILKENYTGPVFSLDVPPWHHYVSNGVLTANSILYREFDHIYRYGPHNLPEARHARVCPVTGALQFIRLSTLQKIGVYDETFKLGWEDVDYNVRAWQAGLEIIYQPGVRAIHHEGFFRGQGRHSPDSKVAKWQEQSWQRFREKWGSTNFSEFIPSLSVTP